MGVRKNQALLTAAEKAAFVAAIKQLKASGMYDSMVGEHRAAMLTIRPAPAHGGPAFFPWHREMLRRLELDLQSVDPTVTLPYWDWTRDRLSTSSIWSADFMGGDGSGTTREVITGPFAYRTGQWTLTVNDTASQPPYLRRALGAAVLTLPTATQVNAALATVPYDSSPWNSTSSQTTSFRNRAERVLHNRVHNWVAGTMTAATSPNDPVFWLHHCNMDRLWARWQRRNPTQGYLPTSGALQGHNLNDPMWPWTSEPNPPTPASVLDHSALGYSYDDEASW